MDRPFFSKVAGVGFIFILAVAVVHICIAYLNRNQSLSAVPIIYKLIVVALCWIGIALVYGLAYFAIKKFIKR